MKWTHVEVDKPLIGQLCLTRSKDGYYELMTYRGDGLWQNQRTMTASKADGSYCEIKIKAVGYNEVTHWAPITEPEHV